MASASATTRDTGRRALNVQRTRRRLTIEGIRLIERQGFTRTTVDQIAEAAGVSQRTFFRYFPCKEALLFGGDRSYDEELSRLEFPPDGESLGQSLRHMAVSWESHGDAHQQRRRRIRYELQDEHPSIGLYLDDALRRLEPQVSAAAARRLRVDPMIDLRPLVVAQLHTALCRLVVRRPPGDQSDFLDRWFDAAAHVLRDAPS